MLTFTKQVNKSFLSNPNFKAILGRFYSSKTFLDPYEVLELKSGANIELVKSAYIRLSKKYHPDTNQHDKRAKDKFINITNAYRKIMESFSNTSRNSTSAAKSQQDDLGYSFTIEHLGVETHPFPTVFDHPNVKRAILLICFAVGMSLLDNFTNIFSRVKENNLPADIEEEKDKKQLKLLEKYLMHSRINQDKISQEVQGLVGITDKFKVQR